MTEDQFQEVLIGRYDPKVGGFSGGLLQTLGWRVQHVERVTMSGRGGRVVRKTPGTKGYPDITAARRGQILFLELKSETGQVEPEQVAWLNELCGQLDLTVRHWRSRGVFPDGFVHGAGCDSVWEPLSAYWPSSHLTQWGGAVVMVAVVRPRHLDWLSKALAR